MFILDTDRIPATADELSVAIDRSLQKFIRLPLNATPVAITGNLPLLSTLAIDISNGEMTQSPSVSTSTAIDQGNTEPGPSADSFTIVGDSISISGIVLTFKLSAKQVAFAYARDAAEKLTATVRDASDGHFSIDISLQQLEAGLLKIVRSYAGSTGVTISKVQATLTSVSPTELDVLLDITAKKFVTAVIRVSGRLSVNDEMVAMATNLKAYADGMVGGIAVNFLRPYLQKMEGVPLPLMAFSLGNVRLSGVQVQTVNGVQISAEFGSGAL